MPAGFDILLRLSEVIQVIFPAKTMLYFIEHGFQQNSTLPPNLNKQIIHLDHGTEEQE